MDRTINTLTASIKALDDVIIPTLDQGDPLAVEQAGLVREYLGFLRGRVDFLHSKALIELDDAYRLLKELLPQIRHSDETLAAVAEEEIGKSRGLLNDSRVPTTELHQQTARALAVVRTFIRSSGGDDSIALQARILVSALAERSETFDRVWFAPLGFDQFANDLPPFEEALRDRLEAIDVESVVINLL